MRMRSSLSLPAPSLKHADLLQDGCGIEVGSFAGNFVVGIESKNRAERHGYGTPGGAGEAESLLDGYLDHCSYAYVDSPARVRGAAHVRASSSERGRANRESRHRYNKPSKPPRHPVDSKRFL